MWLTCRPRRLPRAILACLALAVFLGLLSTAPALAADAPQDTLGFEVGGGPEGIPGGWGAGPTETLHRDSTIVHGGRYSARLERTAKSPEEFSALSRRTRVTFSGDTLELRGWLRLEGVKGFAGLWLREDGPVGVVQFDNMQARRLDGTREWTEYRIALPLDRAARTIQFGALLAGEGKVWVDDLQLLVNGQAAASAPPIKRAPTAVDTDHEFDAGSGIQAAALSRAQIENLVLLGKVWGFVKYHHPRVASAGLHWDYELFRVIPSILEAPDRASAARILSDWLARVGDPPPCAPCARLPDGAQMLPRVAWIHDRAKLGADLSARLERIYRDRAGGGDPYYVALNENVRNPDFHNEEPYADRPYPDAGYRLLALYRFWNIIEYWYPDRDLIRESWDGVLAEFIPRVVAAAGEEAYKLAIMALIARVHDGHANLWNAISARPPRGECRLPVVARFVEGRAVVTAYAHPKLGPATGLHIGDVIDSLDGRPVSALLEEWEPYYAGSNREARLRDMARSLTQGPCGPVRVTGERAGVPAGARFDLTADRAPSKDLDPKAGLTHDLPGETFRHLTHDVAYLKLSSVSAEKAADYIRQAAGTRGLVIDIRNYPSEFVVFALGRHLVGRKTPFARFTHGDLANPGAFLWTEPFSLEPAEPRYEGTVVILVDESSQSQAEYTAMAFRSAPHALVVGSTTAGADGNISFIPLPGGLRAAISGIGVFYPDRKPTQQVGIVPDLEARPTIGGIREGRDEVLDAAVQRLTGRNPKTIIPR